MADYSEDIASAQADIAEAGALAIITREGIPYPCSIVFAQFSTLERATQLVRNEDRKVILAAGDLPFVINTETDQLIVGDNTYRIVTSNPVAPDDTPIIFELQARKI